MHKKNKKWYHGASKWLIYSFLGVVLVSALSGISALTFFFAYEFNPNIYLDSIISGLMFVGYSLSFGPSTAQLAKDLAKKLGLVDEEESTEETVSPEETPEEDKKKKASKIRYLLMPFVIVTSAISLVLIGLGSVIGANTIVGSFKLAGKIKDIVMGLSWWSGFCMLVALGGFSMPKLFANLKDLFSSKTNSSAHKYVVSNKRRYLAIGLRISFCAIALLGVLASCYFGIGEIAQSFALSGDGNVAFQSSLLFLTMTALYGFAAYLFPKLKKSVDQSLLKVKPIPKPIVQNPLKGLTLSEKIKLKANNASRWIARNYREAISLGAALGFTGFKLYSFEHFLQYVNVTDVVTVDILSLIAFVSLFTFTILSSGYSIWKEFKAYGNGETPPKEKVAPKYPLARKIGKGVGQAIGFVMSLTMGVGAFMGLVTISSIPGLNIALATLAIFGAVCRFWDFSCFTVPDIVKNNGKFFSYLAGKMPFCGDKKGDAPGPDDAPAPALAGAAAAAVVSEPHADVESPLLSDAQSSNEAAAFAKDVKYTGVGGFKGSMFGDGSGAMSDAPGVANDGVDPVPDNEVASLLGSKPNSDLSSSRTNLSSSAH